jgi:hypothetical protein
MADRIEHIHHDTAPSTDTGSLLAVVLLVVLLAIIGFALFAYNGSLRAGVAPARNDMNVGVDLPNVDMPDVNVTPQTTPAK